MHTNTYINSCICNILYTRFVYSYVMHFTGYKLAFNYMKARRFVDSIDACLHVSFLKLNCPPESQLF